MEANHRLPIGDIRNHMMSMECPCKPQLVEGDEYDVVYHHAFDRREIVIEAEIALGIRCERCLEYIDGDGNHIEEPPVYNE